MENTPVVAPAEIKRLLLRRGWTYQALADALTPPVNRSTVARWLTGAPPRPNHAHQLRALIDERAGDATIDLPGDLGEWTAAEETWATWREQLISEGNPDDDTAIRLADHIIRLSRATRQAMYRDRHQA